MICSLDDSPEPCPGVQHGFRLILEFSSSPDRVCSTVLFINQKAQHVFRAHASWPGAGGIYPARRTPCPKPYSDSALILTPSLSNNGTNAGRPSPLRPPLANSITANATRKPGHANATIAYRAQPDVAPLAHLAAAAGASGQMNTHNVSEGKPAPAGAEP